MKHRPNTLLAGLCCFTAALSMPAAASAQEYSFDTPSDDRWHYPFNFTPGTRPVGSCFGAPGIHGFNDRDGVIIVAWETDAAICPGLGPEAYDIAVVVVTLTNQTNPFVVPTWPADLTTDEWFTFDINTDGVVNADGIPRGEPGDVDGESEDLDAGRPIELFGTGFGPVYSAATWVETSLYVGSSSGADEPRDPFPFVYQEATFDVVHVEDSVKGLHNEGLAQPPCEDAEGVCPFTAQPWAIGVPIGYSPGNQTVPFDVDFDVDLGESSGAVKAYFQNSLSDGRVIVSVTSLREADVMGSQSGYPTFYMKEGLFDAGSKAPKLRIVLAREVLADFDADCDIDLADHAEFHACLAGPNAGQVNPGCDVFDFEPDGDVDLADFSVFARLLQ